MSAARPQATYRGRNAPGGRRPKTTVSLQLTLPVELHTLAKTAAVRREMTLTEFVRQAIDSYAKA